jgi:hypothetical protein
MYAYILVKIQQQIISKVDGVFIDDDEVRFVLHQQQSAGRHVTPL